jgi:arginyl-tRNA synthetase
VDARQSDHFRMLFDTARRWGYDRTDYRHVSFGTILGEDKRPFRTRAGDTVGLESLLDEAVARARQIVDANDDGKPDGPELDDTTRRDVAEAVGIGGIKYADLRHNRDSDYVFSWEKMLAKTGDTATYIQYAYARISGIFRKGGVDGEALRNSGGRIVFTHPAERALALQLARFADTIGDVLLDDRPNILTAHLFETANRFATFYNECPVKNEEDAAVRTSRFLLCDLTARVLAQGLSLLGIRTCERM